MLDEEEEFDFTYKLHVSRKTYLCAYCVAFNLSLVSIFKLKLIILHEQLLSCPTNSLVMWVWI